MEPLNKHYLVKIFNSDEDSAIFIPENLKKKMDKHVRVGVLAKSEDCKYEQIDIGDLLLVIGSMVESYKFKDEEFHLVPESALLGKL